MSTKKTNHELAEYLRLRLEYLEQCASDYNEHLDWLQQALNNRIREGVCHPDAPEIGKAKFFREYILANTFRYAMLVALCSYLEEAIKEITRRLVHGYHEKIQAERDGNWLTRHARVLEKEHGMDFAPIEKEQRAFGDLIDLRNCIVHAWGKVAEARRPRAVEAAAGRVATACITKDGFLFLGEHVLIEAIEAAEKIVDYILCREFDESIT